MKLTIESMTYGADGLAHADNGKAVFVQGAVAGDTVEAEIVQDGKSFMRARATEILEPSPDRIQPPCPFVGICGGCSWGNLSRTAQLAAKEQNLRSTLERIGKFAPEQADELVQPIRHTKDDWGYRNKIELEPTVVNGRVRLGMHGVDPSKIVTVDSCPLFDKRFPKALKSVVGALNYLSGSHDLGLERVGIRASRRTKALEVALWTPTGSFPRSQVSRVLAVAAHPTSIVRVMSKGEKKGPVVWSCSPCFCCLHPKRGEETDKKTAAKRIPFSGFCDVERPRIVPVLHRHTRIIAAEYVEMGFSGFSWVSISLGNTMTLFLPDNSLP